ncbi:hypothetical protein QR680_016604 [Steinernema hermaphroditum]|nr:hypothetical protein QR680_016604 [Steinernema hermaphroditum]
MRHSPFMVLVQSLLVLLLIVFTVCAVVHLYRDRADRLRRGEKLQPLMINDVLLCGNAEAAPPKSECMYSASH